MRIGSLFFILLALGAFAQFDPAGGEEGSFSVHKDDVSIIGWATGADLQRGYAQINDTTLGYLDAGEASNATGAFDGSTVSLGDGGSITLTFDRPIKNTTGYDFAIFENGFKVGVSYYLELAHVEVSENGDDFVRFASESLTDTSNQINNFSYIDPRAVHNLAGKHQAPYGTLFDLEELGMEEINYIRIVDVVGSVIDSLGSRDSKGRLINDPWPSPFPSGGFDLDAVAVVNGELLSRQEYVLQNVRIYPSQAHTLQEIKVDAPTGAEIIVFDVRGDQILTTNEDHFSFALAGVYLVRVQLEDKIFTQKIVVR